MAEFDWEKAWDANRNVGTLWGERLDTTREAIITTAKKYAAHALRAEADVVLAPCCPHDFARHLRGVAECLDPQPEVIQLEKGKVYRFPDGAEVRT